MIDYSDAAREQIVRRGLEDGLVDREIAEHLGSTLREARALRISLNLDPVNQHRWRQERSRRIAERNRAAVQAALDSGATTQAEIAAHTGMSYSNAYLTRRRHGMGRLTVAPQGPLAPDEWLTTGLLRAAAGPRLTVAATFDAVTIRDGRGGLVAIVTFTARRTVASALCKAPRSGRAIPFPPRFAPHASGTELRDNIAAWLRADRPERPRWSADTADDGLILPVEPWDAAYARLPRRIREALEAS